MHSWFFIGDINWTAINLHQRAKKNSRRGGLSILWSVFLPHHPLPSIGRQGIKINLNNFCTKFYDVKSNERPLFFVSYLNERICWYHKDINYITFHTSTKDSVDIIKISIITLYFHSLFIQLQSRKCLWLMLPSFISRTNKENIQSLTTNSSNRK